jgi:cell division protein FtsZ
MPAPASAAILSVRTESGPPAEIPALAGAATTSAPAAAKEKHESKLINQEEFGFGEVESRGHFEKSDRNLFDGQDLDVPTYLRKGIKIVL